VKHALPALSEATLSDLRRQIDGVDEQLLGLLARRCGLVRRVQQLKRASGMPARNAGREREIFLRAGALARRLGMPDEGAVAVLRDVLRCSLLAAGVADAPDRLPRRRAPP